MEKFVEISEFDYETHKTSVLSLRNIAVDFQINIWWTGHGLKIHRKTSYHSWKVSIFFEYPSIVSDVWRFLIDFVLR